MRGQVGLRRSGSRFRVITFLVLFLTLYHCYGISPDGKVLLELKKSFGNNKDLLGLLRTWNKSDPDPCMWRGVECNSQQRVVTLNVSKGYASSNSCNEKDSNQNAASCAWFLRLVDQQGHDPHDQCKLRATPLDTTLGSGYAVCLENRSNLNGTSGCTVSSKLPASISELSELRVLSLTNCGLSGEIPREVSKLRFLEVLDLHGNGFVGHVLPEIGNLKSLRVLDLGYNMLSGKIPDAIRECGNLETLNLGGNVLNGSIPDVAIGNLIKLRYLNLGFNHISGPLTAELFKECHNLEHLHVASNLLIGEIPSELGNCPRLRTVLMFSNFIEGAIPAALGKLSMLETLDISRNSLSHEIPQELGNCKMLSVLVLKDLVDYSSAKEEDYSDIDPSTGFSNGEKGEFNYFEGGIPASVVMLPLIKIIWSPRATLSGRLPEDWGECSSLEVLNLGQNEFSGRIPRGLRKCKKLFFLDLSNNHFKETLPQLTVPCLLVFNVSMNELSGNVPVPSDDNCSLRSSVQRSSAPVSVYSSFFLCSSSKSSPVAGFLADGLTVLHDYSYNNFTGMIPAPKIAVSILRDQPSYGLLLNGNQFFGKLPNTLFSDCQGFQSYGMNFSSNAVSGEISSGALGKCKSLRFLDASNNMITGTIPSSIGSLTNLEYVDMSNNGLQGSIPSEIQGLKDLKFLSLAGNKLSGSILEGVGKITSLSYLDLSSNAFTGDIPQDLVNLKQLKVLYLQQNKLSGQIPTGFASLNSLTSLNVSYNKLSGEIPTLKKELDCDSYEGNHFMPPCHSASFPSEQPEQMRGSLPDASAPLGTTNGKSKSFNTLEIAAVASASAVIFCLVIFVMVLVYTRRHNAKSPSQRSGRKEVVTFNNIGVQLTYENVVRATGNFSVGHLIGHGGFGATYKAEITPGLIVAVKRLSVGKVHGIQQFDTEVRTLGRIKHPNLVTLIGYHGSESEMFLIYNYLPGGNLESFIHDNTDRNADWRILHKIALDIAKALAYLHDECVPRVLHRDIKPSNILLDNDLKAHLSDFGLARLLGASETHATTDVAGTFGYLAPEYAMTCRVSEKADVYSYGVVLLELLSGKKALDPSFSSYGNGFNIVAWGCMLLREGRAREFYTKGLWDSGPHDALIEALHLAVMCTVDSLSIRPLMRQVVDRLNGIQPHSST